MPKTKKSTKAPKRARKSPPPQNDNKYFRIGRSPVAGRGAFAIRRIRKGTRLIEYKGEIVTNEEADRRYPDDEKAESHHTMLFTLTSKTLIDAEFEGNDARFINHSCDPNCETTQYGKEIWIEAKRTIEPGEELAYDYKFDRSDDPKDDKWQEKLYICRCGAPRCRGTMLVPRRKKRRDAKKKTVRK
jgi:SET domain-containing protein